MSGTNGSRVLSAGQRGGPRCPRSGWFVLFLMMSCCAGTAAPQEAEPDVRSATGTIRGVARDLGGNAVSGACVVLCDGKTGYPLVAETLETFVDSYRKRRRFRPDDYVFQITDEDGLFRFHKIPYGAYRVVGQSWINPPKPVTKPMDRNGKDILFLGAQNVDLMARASRQVVLQQPGTGILVMNEECGNSSTWFLLSTAPTRADPVLGPIGWGGEFFRNFIGWNTMPLGDTTVRGLPAGTVHFALFAPDNVPGFGAGSARVVAGKSVMGSAPFVAEWSDGVHEPPPRLRSLAARVAKLQKATSFDVTGFLAKHGVPGFARLLDAAATDALVEHLPKTVALPDGTKATVADLLAIAAYQRMQARLASRARKNAATAVAPEDADYEENFKSLYHVLRKNYAGFSIKQIDWQAVGRDLLPRAAAVNNHDDFARLCAELVARLEDSHAFVASGTARIPVLIAPQWDAGFSCLIDDRNQSAVYHIDRDGPAAVAGMKVGTVIVSVDGVPAAELIDRTMSQLKRYHGWSSERYLRYQAARWFARSSERSRRQKIKCRSVDGKEFVFEMAATKGRRYRPRLPVPIPGISDSRDLSWTRLKGDIGYIYVRRISPKLIASLDRAVGELRDASGLIIDVRGNSGGGFDAARSHRNFDTEDGKEPDRPRFTGPMALLIDGRCISAGEGWSSWFIARKRARVFGTATAGASSRKTTYELPNKLFRVTYSVKSYRGYLDRPIERRGLEPEVRVRQSATDLAEGRDTVLEAAKTWLIQQ